MHDDRTHRLPRRQPIGDLPPGAAVDQPVVRIATDGEIVIEGNQADFANVLGEPREHNRRISKDDRMTVREQLAEQARHRGDPRAVVFEYDDNDANAHLNNQFCRR